MAFTNNVMIVRHGLLAKLVKLWKEKPSSRRNRSLTDRVESPKIESEGPLLCT